MGLAGNMSPILNPNLRGFFESNVRYYVLYGGRASGKTYHTAGFCVFLACEYSVRFLCVRQFQNRLSDSVKSTIEECIDLAGLRNEFYITDNEISHITTGSKFTFLGINRNLNEIKGMSGIEVLWIEEAEGLTEEQWSIIMPTIRAENSKIFIVFNPRLVTDFVWKRFVVNPQKDSVVRKINYDENPYLSSTMKKVIEDAKDDQDFPHIYLGEPKSDDEAAIIKRSWLLAAIDAHIKLGIEPRGSKTLGFDVADGSDNPNDQHDECAIVEAHGPLFTWCEAWRAREDEILESATKTWNIARGRGDTLIIYDSIGVGASCGNRFNQLNAQNNGVHKIAHQKFPAGGAPNRPDQQYKDTKIKNKNYFANIKAQSWYTVAERFMNTYNAVTKGHKFDDADMLFLSSDMPNLERLIDELSTPKKVYDNAGRVMVERKQDLIKRGIKSPNLADALIMAASPIRPMFINPHALR